MMLEDPELRLATIYAPVTARPALSLLWALDARLATIARTTREPLIGEMRLAWWREALIALDTKAAPAEPLLQAIAATLIPAGVSGATLATLEDGWLPLIDTPGEADAAAIATHGMGRGRALFGIAARLLGGDAADPLALAGGEGWALVDFAAATADPAQRGTAAELARAALAPIAGLRWPRALRPLGMLARLAARDAETIDQRRQGSPGRIAAMLAHRITGR